MRSSRWALSWMMRVEALAVRAARFSSAQQLGGVADRGKRIADLVRDVGGEPAERRELELLRLVLERDMVLEEDHA